ncbi:MAG: DUF3494 domain-containing protein [Comamonadaceae bacterium]|nr:MAG: DUF3494 domain-containing protein [Comamonadaceae bacterium]
MTTVHFIQARPWFATLMLTALVAGCGGGGGRDEILGTGNAQVVLIPPPASVLPGTIPGTGAGCAASGPTVPVVTASTPTPGNQLVTTSTLGTSNGGKVINATFNLPMDPSSITAATFQLAPAGGAALVPASVTYGTATMAASLTTSAALLPATSYTAVIQSGVKSAAGVSIGCPYAWTFRTAAAAAVGVPPPALGTAARYGSFGGSAGMTNSGNQTIITGSNGTTADIGTIAVAPSSITGFHDSAPSDVYTEVPGVNVGNVTGKIYSCTTSTTGPTAASVSAPSCALATQARLDAQAAYLALVALPAGANPGANLAGLTLAPGVYTAPAGSFIVQGNNLTLDAQGDANAVWVFQMATSLTVGGPGAAFPQSVILTNGAQAKNVSWQVGSAATINAAGGGAMVGTVISQAGAAFSTAGNATLTTLEGRALSLNASVTLVNTAITVPAP